MYSSFLTESFYVMLLKLGKLIKFFKLMEFSLVKYIILSYTN